LQETDAEDVTQDVLLKIALKMKTFASDAASCFRAWLKTLTHQA
jgi:DNA-directed RNA polymerase specialized sigma24 family protein